MITLGVLDGLIYDYETSKGHKPRVILIPESMVSQILNEFHILCMFEPQPYSLLNIYKGIPMRYANIRNFELY